MSSRKRTCRLGRQIQILAVAASALLCCSRPASAQRLLGIDISAWQGNLSTSNWSTLHNTNDRDFVFIRSSRGGTTGFDHNHDNLLTSNANCGGVSTDACLSRRYDDPYFGQNITRATNAGLFAGTYHRSRADIIGTSPDTGGIANSGTDEASHMIQMAGPWMRPGYLPPVLDFEDGITERTDQEMAQFALDFSNRIYEVMQIRPAIYINGNYAQNSLAGGTATQRSQLAQQSSNPPSVVSPAYSTLWSARWPNQNDPNSIDVQNLDPTIGFSNIYGPWDDYGVAHPWSFWQYASTARLSGYASGGANIDVNVSHGDIEFVKDRLVPALWWNDNSGNWSTLANWNSGQPVTPPPVVANMTPRQGSTTLPVPRLPGAAGSGPNSGQNDTVILERPNANITVTLSSGTHNIRKLYVRESLDITGGSLTINYNPDYAVPEDGSGNPLYPNAVRSGPISAQFSGRVSIGGNASLSVHTLQVDATRDFVIGNSTLSFNRINLMPHSTAPAEIYLSGNVNFNPLNNAAAAIANGSGTGNSGRIELVDGANPVLNVADGAAAVDLAINVPIVGTGLTKTGPGTLALNGLNNYNGDTVVQAGELSVTSPNGLNQQFDNEWDIHLSTGAILGLQFTGAADMIRSLFIDGVSQPAGIWGAEGSGAPFTSPLITGTGRLEVTQFVPPPLVGDFNDDGSVDAADYIVWRKTDGTPTDYSDWRANFGRTSPGAGSASALSGDSAVPEPSAVVMLSLGIAGVVAWRHKRIFCVAARALTRPEPI
jgi:autotransporter-associated beta strand protein